MLNDSFKKHFQKLSSLELKYSKAQDILKEKERILKENQKLINDLIPPDKQEQEPISVDEEEVYPELEFFKEEEIIQPDVIEIIEEEVEIEMPQIEPEPSTSQQSQGLFTPNQLIRYVKKTEKPKKPPLSKIISHRTFSCDSCSIKFLNEIALNHHLKFVHKLQYLGDSKSGDHYEVHWLNKEGLIQKSDEPK
jgi:hypothetical protein